MKLHLTTLLAAALIAAPAAADIGRVKRAQGQAAVLRAGAALPARPGLVLLPGDTLRTGKDGRLALTFSDDTRFAVGPNSNINLSRFDYDRRSQRGRFVTQVNRGSLAVVSGRIAKGERDAMKVRTPTSLLGVRGTRFVISVP